MDLEYHSRDGFSKAYLMMQKKLESFNSVKESCDYVAHVPVGLTQHQRVTEEQANVGSLKPVAVSLSALGEIIDIEKSLY